MKVKITKRRSITSFTSQGLEYIIPTKMNWFFAIFFGFWIAIWSIGEFTLLRQAITGDQSLHIIVLLVAFGGWTVGGLLIIFVWLWNLFGKEHIILRQDVFLTKKEIFGIGRTYEYDISNVNNLRVAKQYFNVFDLSYKLQSWGFGPGLIVFDYGSRTFHCACNIDEAEASEIIKELQSKHNFNKE